MNIEYEATFVDVDKAEIRKKLTEKNAVLLKAEFMQRRVTFNLPTGHEITGGWVRVRDENDRITMTFKSVSPGKISDQKEIELVVDDFYQAVNLLTTIGCEKKAYQETKRELWQFENVEVALDEWPYLEPFVEIEGPSEEAVKKASSLLGFDYQNALFCSVDTLYSQKYGLTTDYINNKIPVITFKDPNPFVAV